MKVRMVQQMSGSRADGSRWPDVGEILETSDEEGMLLCATTDNSPNPIAVPVGKDAKDTVKHMDEDPRIENRGEGGADEQPADKPAEDGEPKAEEKAKDDDDPIGDPGPAPEPKRGPGRPRKDSLPK